MSGKGADWDGTAAPVSAAGAFAADLASLLKNAGLYPADHPRVAGTAHDLLAVSGEVTKAWPLRLVVHGDKMFLGGESLGAICLHTTWLFQRLRMVGLRGLELAADVTAGDLVAFAVALRRIPPGSGRTMAAVWPADHPRLRGIELLYPGEHGDDDVIGGGNPVAAGEAPTDASGRVTDPLVAHGVAAVRRRLAADRRLLAQLEDLLRACEQPERGGHALDLLHAIAEVLPVDVARDPQAAAATASKVIAAVGRELIGDGLGSGPRDAELLRRALLIARRYFAASAPHAASPHELPSGRPGDERYAADVDALLAELAALPGTPRKFKPGAAEDGPAMALRLCGICLHCFTTSTRPQVLAKARALLDRHLRELDDRRLQLLDAYLGPDPAAPVPAAGRRRLLDLLLAHGRTELVLGRGYVDERLVTEGFPESLPLAVRLLTATNDGRAVLRRALITLAPVLASGGVDAAESAGVLRDPDVIAALASAGDDAGLPLLVRAAAARDPALKPQLIGHLRSRRLPAAEQACVQFLGIESVPADYVRELYAAVQTRNISAELRRRSTNLLHDHVEEAVHTLPRPELVAAIDALRLVPGPATVALLQRLARHRRFTGFGRRARAVRAAARTALHALAAHYGAAS